MRESRFWLLHLLAGLALVFLLGVHLVLMHLGPGDPLVYERVARRAESPGWQLFYLIFLAFALYHGLYGLRGILLEVLAKKGRTGLLTGFLAALGILAFAFGAYVVVAA